MPQALDELTALLRGVRLATSLRHTLRFLRSGAGHAVRAFDDVVAPIIDRIVADGPAGRQVRDALLFASVKGSYLISSYSSMIGAPFPVELSVLGGSFARLYDDLIDDVGGVDLDERVADLFQGRPFVAHTDLEQLLAAFHQAIESRLNRPADDPIHSDLRALHEHQILSRQQRDTVLSTDSLRKITAAKGSFANVALFGLVRPQAERAERDLIMFLGESLQLLDDYVDLDTDLAGGIATPVTRGAVTLVDLTEQLRMLRPRLLRFYGTRAHQFVTVLYILLIAAFLKRRRLTWRRRAAAGPAAPAVPRGAIGILIRHGDGVCPGLRRRTPDRTPPSGRARSTPVE